MTGSLKYMTKITLSLILTLLITAAAFGQANDTWIKFSPAEGRFSVLMPAQPEPSIETTTATTTNVFVASENGTFYLAGWADYKPDFNLDIETELKATRDNFIKGLEATLLNETKISLDGNPGIEFTAERKADKASVKSRVYIVGKRPYQLATVVTQGDVKNIEKFYSSFKLTK